jgi:hypothetical protein
MIKKLFQENKWGFIISSIIVFLGSALMYIFQTGTFDAAVFFSWFPLYYAVFIGLFVGIGIFAK